MICVWASRSEVGAWLPQQLLEVLDLVVYGHDAFCCQLCFHRLLHEVVLPRQQAVAIDYAMGGYVWLMDCLVQCPAYHACAAFGA